MLVLIGVHVDSGARAGRARESKNRLS